MKNKLLAIGLCLLGVPGIAQTLHIESGALIHVSDPTAVNGLTSATPTLFIQGDVVNNGGLVNGGEVQFTGDLTSNGTYNSTGDDVFNGNATQTLNGSFSSGNSFFNLLLNKGGTVLDLTSNTDVEEGIYLTDGVLRTNGNTLHLKNSTTPALHSTAPSGSANNFIEGALRQDINTGIYTFYTGDASHDNQKVILNFSNTGGATFMDVNYSSAGAGSTSILGCNSNFDKQSGNWSITPNGVNGTYNYSITLEPGGANLAAISPSVYDGMLKDGIFITNPCAQVSGNYTVSGLNSFSSFKLASTTNIVLPVTLTNFHGKHINGYNQLEWETAGEINNDHFNVQKSADGVSFTTFASVRTKAVNGNSSLPLAYGTNDMNPRIGNNYYRLEQVDIDNKKHLSKIINIVLDNTMPEVTISPNPGSDITHVVINTNTPGMGKIVLQDMSGRTVKMVQLNLNSGINNTDLAIDDIAQGMYQVSVYINNQLLKTIKLNKQ